MSAALNKTVADLMRSIEALSEKIDRCEGFCEAILDEVTPIGLALDALAAAPETAD